MSRLPIALACLCPLSLSAAEPLRVGISDALTSPYMIEDPAADSPPRGRAIDLARSALRRCGLDARFLRQPGKRLVQNLGLDRLDGALLLSYQPPRRGLMAYPMRNGQADPSRRMATFDYAFYIRDDSDLSWNGARLRGLEGPVGINRGWSIERDLRELGLRVENGNAIGDNFAKLQAGRIQAYAVHRQAGDLYLRHHPELKIRRLSPPLLSKTYYWVFSRGYAHRHPRQTECLWRQLPRLRAAYLPDNG
ncbi:substrate-binding periplasmic protein [Chromobacterium piscinae]|uniref:Transporter substrate-binding domain-containing protein n=2 Tax=Chromobacterium piscinae TaxID=686831 RepID=A0ABV0H390_9NEIS|nr:transporter substrate-binding domain-containing protein [Chromobacterium piscinae]MCD5327343.1 transporter substrate-binding domain-containing protein [Chromobacterium piscinae]